MALWGFYMGFLKNVNIKYVSIYVSQAFSNFGSSLSVSRIPRIIHRNSDVFLPLNKVKKKNNIKKIIAQFIT